MTGSCGVLNCNVSLDLRSNENRISTISEAHRDSKDSTSSNAPILQQLAPRGQLLDLLNPKVGELSFVHHADVKGSSTLVKDGSGEFISEYMGAASENNYQQVGNFALHHDLCDPAKHNLFTSLDVYKVSF